MTSNCLILVEQSFIPPPYVVLNHISNMKEKDLVKNIGLRATAKIWGGPALTIGCVLYLTTN